MIRTADIKEKQKEITILKKRAADLERHIEKYYKDQDTAESGSEYAILDAHISGSEKRLEIILGQIEQAEHELKVMKGEAEPKRLKPWTLKRTEISLECFGV